MITTPSKTKQKVQLMLDQLRRTVTTTKKGSGEDNKV
jgi:hypothetical protein